MICRYAKVGRAKKIRLLCWEKDREQTDVVRESMKTKH
jgi:hypothetical protein